MIKTERTVENIFYFSQTKLAKSRICIFKKAAFFPLLFWFSHFLCSLFLRLYWPVPALLQSSDCDWLEIWATRTTCRPNWIFRRDLVRAWLCMRVCVCPCYVSGDCLILLTDTKPPVSTVVAEAATLLLASRPTGVRSFKRPLRDKRTLELRPSPLHDRGMNSPLLGMHMEHHSCQFMLMSFLN